MSKHDSLKKLVPVGSRLTLTEQALGELASTTGLSGRELLVTEVKVDEKTGRVLQLTAIISEPRDNNEMNPITIEIPESEDHLVVGREQFTSTFVPKEKGLKTVISKFAVEPPRAGFQPEPSLEPKAVDGGGEVALGAVTKVVEPELKSQTQIDAEDAAAAAASKTK